MPQTTILTAGTDQTKSTEFTVGPRDNTKVALFPGSGNLDIGAYASIIKKGVKPADPTNFLAGPGTEDQAVAFLGSGAGETRPVVWISEPGTYYVRRPMRAVGDTTAAYGVYIEPAGRDLF